MTAPFMVAPGQSIQRLERAIQTFTDQHGRQFEATVDIRNNRPIGEFRPLGFMPPWLPTMRFIWWDRDKGNTFRWAYRQLANELSSHTATWYGNARKMALKEHLEVPEVGGTVHPLIRDIFGNPGLSPEIPLAAEYGDQWLLWGDDHAPRSQALFEILHQGLVMQSNEALDIIEQRVRDRMGITEPGRLLEDHGVVGNLEALQQKPPKPVVATSRGPVRPITYNEFVAEHRAGGVKMPQIVELWHAHKASLRGEPGVTEAA